MNGNFIILLFSNREFMESDMLKTGTISSLCDFGGIYNHQTTNVMFIFEIDGSFVLVPAHKCILAADSSVFRRIFYEKFPNHHNFRIIKTPIDKFCQFLASFYAKSMKLKRNDVAEVLELALKFNATKCLSICMAFLEKTLDIGIDDVLWALQIAIEFKLTDIYERCMEKVHLFGWFLIETNEFCDSSCEVIKAILNDDFAGRNEMKLFEACIKWCKQQTTYKYMTAWKRVRHQMGDFFQMIHFDSMTSNEFIECLSKYAHYFRIDEIQEISNKISQSTSNMESDQNRFKIVPRGRLMTINRIFEHPTSHLIKLYLDIETSDVQIIVDGNVATIPAHRSILAMKSPVFSHRFFGPTRIKMDKFRVELVKSQIFHDFMKLLYGYPIDKVVTVINFADILALACIYGTKDIFKGQESELKKFVNVDNLFWVVNLCEKYHSFIDSLKFNVKWLKSRRHKFQLNQAFHPNSLISCSRKMIEQIVTIHYSDRDEAIVFEAVINWAKHWCLINHIDSSDYEMLAEALDDIFWLYPFHNVTKEQFDNWQFNYPGLLKERELLHKCKLE